MSGPSTPGPGVRPRVAGARGGFSAADLLPFVSQDGADVVIVNGTQEIRIENTLLSDLGAGDVIFV